MTLILKVNAIQDWTLKGALKSSGLGGGVLKSLCWCQRNETWKEGSETFEKY